MDYLPYILGGAMLMLTLPIAFTFSQDGPAPLGEGRLTGICYCPFQGREGRLKVDESCRSKLRLWMIDEDEAPPTAAKAGQCCRVDGFVLGGRFYKVDGSSCVRLYWEGGQLHWETRIHMLAYALGKRPPHPVPPERVAPLGSPKWPTPWQPVPWLE